MNLKLKRTPGIYLAGFMGSGKSTVGRMLAEELGWRFADLDADIESRQRASISDLFAQRGEAEFRRIETEALRWRIADIRRGQPLVLALGGGAFTIDENVELMNENGITIWIDTPLEVMKQRVAGHDHRPLARDPARFEALYYSRRESYAKAQYRIDVPEGSSRSALRSILELRILD